MKSFISILIAILFCAPTVWGQKKEKPRMKHADMYVFLNDGRSYKGVLYETLDDAILLMSFKQLVKKKGKLYLTDSSKPTRIPVDYINHIIIKPNFFNKGYGLGLLIGAGGTFGVLAATIPEELVFANSYALAPIILISSFTVAPVVGAIHRNNKKVDIKILGNQEVYEINRELLDSFIYFPNLNEQSKNIQKGEVARLNR